ncbi:MAG TPA: aspartyl protease family protein [Pirellulales bacterium]|nr:aspartyl protease family protein [Pirellulales bacterium]
MEISLMGKVMVPATIENLDDVFDFEKGSISADRVRRVDVEDALVDTGATMLSMPKRLIQQLGLQPFRVRRARTSAGTIDAQVYRAVRLTIHGRDCIADVSELPDDCPVLIGQLPLEMLDLVVDPVGQRLIGNPAHGGEHMIEMY